MEPWYYSPFPPSVPRPVKGGLKARSRRGAIGEQWWSQRFIQVLEEMGNASRLQRGKRYARKGQVIGIEIRGGEVQAEVQGSAARPYRVTIRLSPLSDAGWERVFDMMAAQAIFAAQLLAGVVPHEVEELFSEAGVSLFPTSKRISGLTAPALTGRTPVNTSQRSTTSSQSGLTKTPSSSSPSGGEAGMRLWKRSGSGGRQLSLRQRWNGSASPQIASGG